MWHEKTSKTHCGQSKSRGNLNVSQCFSIYIPTIHKANYTTNNIHLKGIKKKDLEGVMHEWLPLTKEAGSGTEVGDRGIVWMGKSPLYSLFFLRA